MFAVQLLLEALTLHVRHYVEEERVCLVRIEQRQDVWVLQVGGRLDLSQEPLGSDYRREFGLQDLQRDLALVLQVLGQVDGGPCQPPSPSSRSMR